MKVIQKHTTIIKDQGLYQHEFDAILNAIGVILRDSIKADLAKDFSMEIREPVMDAYIIRTDEHPEIEDAYVISLCLEIDDSFQVGAGFNWRTTVPEEA